MNLRQIERNVYLYSGGVVDERTYRLVCELKEGDFIIELGPKRTISSWKAVLVLTSRGVGWIAIDYITGVPSTNVVCSP